MPTISIFDGIKILAELRANWELARAGLPLLPIAPLD